MKIKRLAKIMELINNNEIETQDELAEKLSEAGMAVTQATISRDIRELKLTKVLLDNGRQKYVTVAPDDNFIIEKQIRVFIDAVVSIEFAINIIVIKTLAGMAMAVAAAIDAMNLNGILGTIAGDDTLFCVTQTESKAMKIVEKLRHLTKA